MRIFGFTNQRGCMAMPFGKISDRIGTLEPRSNRLNCALIMNTTTHRVLYKPVL